MHALVAATQRARAEVTAVHFTVFRRVRLARAGFPSKALMADYGRKRWAHPMQARRVGLNSSVGHASPDVSLRSFYRRWVTACALGELIGIGSATGAAVAINAVIGDPRSLGTRLITLATFALV